MFATNVPEKLMMERSGHRSIDGLRQYERTNAVQELQVCNALQSRKEVDMDKKAPGVAQPVLGLPSLPGFSGCTFNNCTFKVATPFSPVPAKFQPPVQANFQAEVDYLASMNIQVFLHFELL